MADNNTETIIRGLAKVVVQLQTVIDSINDNTGQVTQSCKAYENMDKRIRNLEQSISKIESSNDVTASELLRQSATNDEIKNSNFLIQMNVIRLLNFLTKGENTI